MGTVYLARDPDLDRNVAIKVLREPMADEELLQRFLREARATASLRHDNLITIYEVGDHDQQPFIAMEYVDGTTIGELIKRRQALPLAQKLSFIEQICAGLHHAHRVGIVHRDIKPANLMVDGQGVIRILDFGIARVANSGMTSDGALIGTLNYMSPEQMLGRPVDFRSDIFSLGAVAYELLSYHQAFPGSLNDGLLQRLPQEAPTPLSSVCPGLPPGLEAIVLRALAKAPLERFADLDEMRTAVRHLRHGMDPHLEVETVVIPSRDKPKPSTRPASSAERRGLLERRARQIAVHRDAARAALARGDLESAAAACDDALTLDPDDADASQLLTEIQQARERSDQESRARRDRERSMRQRVADAEVTLSRGDVATAARLLEQVFSDEAGDPAALALLDKVRDAATAAGVSLPETLNIASARVRPETSAPTRSPLRSEPRRSRVPLFAAAAVVVLAIGGGVLWMINSDRTTPATETNAVASRSDTPSPAPADPSPPPAVVNPSPAPAPQTARRAVGCSTGDRAFPAQRWIRSRRRWRASHNCNRLATWPERLPTWLGSGQRMTTGSRHWRGPLRNPRSARWMRRLRRRSVRRRPIWLRRRTRPRSRNVVLRTPLRAGTITWSPAHERSRLRQRIERPSPTPVPLQQQRRRERRTQPLSNRRRLPRALRQRRRQPILLRNPSLRRRRAPRRQLLRRIPRRQQPRVRARSTP